MQMKMPKFQLAHLGSGDTCQLSCPVAVYVSRTLVPLAVCTALVAFQFDQALQRLLVLHCPVGSGGSPRHGGGCEEVGGGVVCGVATLNCSTKSECNCARGCRGVWV
jgi:hypothetical protein